MNSRSPISFFTKGMLFYTLTQSGTYIQQTICCIEETINLKNFKNAWVILTQRHEILRSSFLFEKEIYQIHDNIDITFSIKSYQELSKLQQQELLEDFLEKDRQTIFEFDKTPLMRFTIFQFSEDQYHFIWTFPHILLDGRSRLIVVKEFFEIYNCLCHQKKLSLPTPQSYRLYSDWIKKNNFSIAKQFFQKQNFIESKIVDNLQATIAGQHATQKVTVDKLTTQQLQRVAKKYDLTLNTLFQGAWSIILAQCVGKNRVTFGATRACRHIGLEQSEDIVGLMINTLPVNVEIASGSQKAFLKKIRDYSIDLRIYEHTPLSKVFEWCNNSRPLFDTSLVFENYEFNQAIKNKYPQAKNFHFSLRQQSHYPFTLIATNSGSLTIEAEYDSMYFGSEYVEYILQNIKDIMQQFAKDQLNNSLSTLKISVPQHFSAQRMQDKKYWFKQIEKISKVDKQLLRNFNNTEKNFNLTHTFIDLWNEQITKAPQNIAVIMNNQKITYRRLDKMANQLANFLQQQNVTPVVGVYMKRGIDMIATLLAIWKSGRAYLPLDPNYPKIRLEYMIKNTQINTIITEEKLAKNLHCTNKICIDRDHQIISECSDFFTRKTSNNPLAYIIYTSGSTGLPKGVMVSHKSIANLLQFTANKFLFTCQDSILALTTISFDISIVEIFLPLSVGGSVVIANDQMRYAPKEIISCVFQHNITFTQFTPAMLSALRECNWHNENVTIISTGEALSSDLAKFFLPKCKKLWNMYGPTETTVWATYSEVINCEKIVIGKPIANTKIYILDEKLHEVPIGAQGEIYIAGESLAQGYFKNRTMTAQRFLPDLICKNSGRVMYRTGDIGYYLPNGEIVCVGRNDSQVKIRGFRIELDEVNNCLREYISVKESCVLVKGLGKNKQLTAYISLRNQEHDQQIKQQIIAFLNQKLPRYMVPQKFIFLQELPHTPNGKVDRKALRESQFTDLVKKDTSKEPRSLLQEKLCLIWEKVLQTSPIGITDNFFELGGHSLLAITLIGQIKEQFKINIPLDSIFKAPTIDKFTQFFCEKHQTATPIVALGLSEYPLSSMQRQVWFLQKLQPQNTSYNILRIKKLEGELNKEYLQLALDKVLRKQQILKSSLKEYSGNKITQIIHEKNVTIEYVHLCKKQNIQEEINKIIRTPFDLTEFPLIRLKLIKLSKKEHILCIVIHHILVDNVSFQIFWKELSYTYNNLLSGQEIQFPKLKIQYGDYCVWENQKNFQKQKRYWIKKLQDSPSFLELPTDKPRPKYQNFSGDTFSSTVDKNLKEKIQKLAKENGCTLFMVLLATYKLLLSRYSGQNKIVVGSPVANRHHGNIENNIGFFANTIVFYNQLNQKQSFLEYLQKIRTTCLEAYTHQDYPFEKLVADIYPQRNTSYNPIFQVSINMLGEYTPQNILQNIKVSHVEKQIITSNFDLTLLIRSEQTLKLNWRYNTDLFLRNTIQRMSQHFNTLLENIVSNPHQNLFRIEMLNSQQQQYILDEYGGNEKKYGKEKTLHEQFEEQTQKTPNNIAVICENKQISYRDLNIKANKIARILREQGAKPGETVAIIIDRSIDMVACILGVLKSGAAYMPVNPSYPKDHISYMIQTCNARILLAANYQNQNLHKEKILINIEDPSIFENVNSNNLTNINSLNDTAYILYTSGSTGQPKAVAVKHFSMFHNRRSLQQRIGVLPSDCYLHTATFTFASSIRQFFLTLSVGATVVVATTPQIQNPKTLLKIIRKNNVSIIDLVPSYYLSFLQTLTNLTSNDQQDLQNSNIRLLLSASEILIPEIPKKWYALLQDKVKFINIYGQTETSGPVATYNIPLANIPATIPVGRPITNTNIYILGNNMTPVPVGITGEIYIQGSGVTKGYLNSHQQTKEKFVKNPFSKVYSYLYKTGDLARWLPNKNIEFFGRSDQQIKIRGFRVEPGEVETALLKHQNIEKAIVVSRIDKSNNKQLVAYIVTVVKDRISISSLRQWLQEKLLSYMIPSHFVELDEIPVTSSGKVNRKALPAPSFSLLKRKLITPKNKWETRLISVWKELLSIDKISIDDDFFLLGGHSLLAIALVGRIKETFLIDFPLHSVFEASTVQHMARLLEKSQQAELIPPLYLEKYPLSSAQKRLWFLNMLEPESSVYNMSFVRELCGELHENCIKKAWNAVVNRQTALQTHFHFQKDGQVVQEIVNKSIPLEIENVSSRTEATKRIETTKELFIDPEQFPLVRCYLFKINSQHYFLCIIMHHIISDFSSLNILWRELVTLYNSYVNNTNARLSNIDIKYGDFCSWEQQKIEKQNDLFMNQRKYWLEKFSSLPPILQLPTDHLRPAKQSFAGARYQFKIEEEILQKFESILHQNHCTLFMGLLAVYSILLKRYSGENDITVGTPIASRHHGQLENVIGFLANTLVLRIAFEESLTFEDLLSKVKEACLGAFENQDYPFEQLVEDINPERNLSYNPIFQVWINLADLRHEKQVNLLDIDVRPYKKPSTTTKFDLSLHMSRIKDLSCIFEYSTDLFQERTIVRLANHFSELLKNIIAKPSQKIVNLDLLSNEEQNKIVCEFGGHEINSRRADFNSYKTITQLFEEQVKKEPNNTALLTQKQKITYQELHYRANQIAQFLMNEGIHKEQIIGVMLERSIDFISAMLGILKVGAAYLPIDPSYPEQHISNMIEISQTNIILSTNKTYKNSKVKILDINGVTAKHNKNISVEINSSNLAYVMFTSGSTGVPKGVAVEHKNVVRLVKETNYVKISPKDVILHASSPSFDAATFEIWGALLNGAKLCIVDKKECQDIEKLSKFIVTKDITIMFLTARLGDSLIDYAIEAFAKIKNFLIGGERLSQQHINKLHRSYPYLIINNAYGPTENTTFSTYYCINGLHIQDIPIGKAITNSTVYILNENLKPVPIGIKGEIYVGGDGVARGYYNNPELSQQKFIKNPFIPESKMYKTGDIGRWLPDGNIDFLGRIDNQIKIRGFRIELNHIEHELHKHPQIHRAVVRVRESISKQIVAYVILKNQFDISQLRTWLSSYLPHYMIPHSFIELEVLPLTINGKIDYELLPTQNKQISHVHVAASNHNEKQLELIWKKILNREKISIKDNFFELGGHSLLAITLISEIKQNFSIDLPLNYLYEKPTIQKIAKYLAESDYQQPYKWSPVICFSSSQKKLPFFCFPGIGGAALYLRNFLNKWSAIQTCYALQPLGFDGKAQPHESIEEMAEYYISHIRKIQPCGPYILGGHSFGGKIAFEIARQLCLRGEVINKLIIIDTPPKIQKANKNAFSRFVSLYKEMYSDLQNLTYEQITSDSPTNDENLNYLKTHFKIYKTQSEIIYKPEEKKYPIPTILYRAEETNREYKVTWGWEEYVEVEVVWTPGAHMSMVTEKYNGFITDHWKKIISQKNNDISNPG
ncbi:amino acid adenylation domain-containing protein [Candidatus Uabimicrobium sp. HlEnr_7]|uniref:non-ribosomal peptide synthetase n=1 Tax=Candidatus Uabimicrobium helgolandensis TaxID=3095367 RepID=UPI0035570C09